MMDSSDQSDDDDLSDAVDGVSSSLLDMHMYIGGSPYILN